MFRFFRKNAVLTDEEKRWDRMWDMWAEGRADSPYAELMTYQSEINNGGHDQYFFNIENTGDLQKEMAVLKTVLPERLRQNLKNAYDAYRKLADEGADGQSETLRRYDDEFYKHEEEINSILRKYSSETGL